MSTASIGLSPMQRIHYATTQYLTRPSANSTAAIVLWLTGALATRTFLGELGMGIESPLIATLLAFTFQAILTLLEGPIWHRHLRSHSIRFVLGGGALLVDVAMNTGGCWVFSRNLGNTTFWQALSSTLGDGGPPQPLTVFAISLLLAVAISAAPEGLWDL